MSRTAPEALAYDAEVARYNDAILARRAATKATTQATRQAAANRREVAKVRTQTCGTCFQVRSAAGSCGC
jgi:hypothetical protein